MVHAVRVKTDLDIEQVIRIIKECQRDDVLLQAIDTRAAVSRRVIEAAYHHASESMMHGFARARSLNNEFLLWLTGQPHVSKAIEVAGIKNPKDFILVSDHPVNDIIERLGATVLNPTFPNTDKGSEGLYSEEEIALERMAWVKARRLLKIKV